MRWIGTRTRLLWVGHLDRRVASESGEYLTDVDVGDYVPAFVGHYRELLA